MLQVLERYSNHHHPRNRYWICPALLNWNWILTTEIITNVIKIETKWIPANNPHSDLDIKACIRFTQQSFGNACTAGVASVSTAQHCPVSHHNQLQLLQKGAADGPSWAMSDAGHMTGRADLRKEKTTVQQKPGERSEKWERCSPAAPKVSTAGGQSSSSLQPGRGLRRSRLFSCSPQAPRRADLHVQPQRSPRASSGWGLKQAQPMERPCRSSRDEWFQAVSPIQLLLNISSPPSFFSSNFIAECDSI